MRHLQNILRHLKSLFFIMFILIPSVFFGQLEYSLSHLKARCIGGKPELKRIIDQEMVYPQQAIESKNEGFVKLCFVVTADSLVKELAVKESSGNLLDNEAIRIFNIIQWVPAFYQGDPIVTYNCIKIPFNIKTYKKTCKKRAYTQIDYPYMPVDTSNMIYFFLDIENNPVPDFTGSTSGDIVDFLAKNIKYPETALKNNLSGIVKIRFIIEPHGMITNMHPVKTVAGGCTEETIRVIKLIRWNPGIDNNMAVRTQAEIAVKFSLPGGGRYQILPILVRGMIN